MPMAAMTKIGTLDGVHVFWAEPGRFDVPGVYYWNGTENVHVPIGQNLGEPSDFRLRREAISLACTSLRPGKVDEQELVERTQVMLNLLGGDRITVSGDIALNIDTAIAHHRGADLRSIDE
ncbi:MAG TPA: hypothetical protein VGW34_09545 [Allosphingosinicella sp.]|nr:hypothetical protein [Allosphingosinicella sp.]